MSSILPLVIILWVLCVFCIPLFIIAFVFGCKMQRCPAKTFSLILSSTSAFLFTIALIFAALSIYNFMIELSLAFGVLLIGTTISAFIVSASNRRNSGPKNKPREKREILDEIKKLKELVDCGALSQNEFEKMKSELLKHYNELNN